MVPLMTLSVFLSFAQTYFAYFVEGSGHPFLLITSAVNLVVVLLLTMSGRWYEPGKAIYLLYLYYYVHAASVTLVYNDWIPEQLQDKKSALKFQNVLNYVVTMAIPFNHWLTALFMVHPPFLLTSYFQIRAEAAFQADYLEFLPEEMRSR